MAFPTIPTVAAGRILSVLATNPAGTHTSPSLSSLTKNSGDLLIAIVIIYDGNSTNAEFSAWGGGFTEFSDNAGTATMGIGCAYKWSTGSETGTFTVTSADASANDSAFFLLSIPLAHATTPPEAGSFATGTGAADPASFNPAGWDAEDTLWIAVGGSGETSTTGSFTGLASAPANFGSYADSGISADVVGGVEGAVAFRQQNAASQDVGAFTGDTSNARDSALVIAVRPAPAATDLAPAPVAVTPAVPAPVLGLSLGLAPSPVATTPAVTTPTLALSLALAPSPVALTLAVPTPALATPLALAPDPVAVTVAVPSSSLVVDQLLAPSPVAVTLDVPAPSLGLSLALAPDPVAATPAVPAAALALLYELAPDPVAATTAVAAPGLQLLYELTPDPVQAIAGVPVSALAMSLAFAPDPVAAVLTVAASTVDAGAGTTTLTPDPVVLVLALPGPVLETPVALSPSPVSVVLSVPAPALAMMLAFSPDPVPALTVVTDSIVGSGLGSTTLTPDPVPVTLEVLAPALVMALAFVPTPIAITLAIPTPTVTGGGAVLPPIIRGPGGFHRVRTERTDAY